MGEIAELMAGAAEAREDLPAGVVEGMHLLGAVIHHIHELLLAIVESYHPWDFSKFGRGERFYYQALPRGEFDDTLAQVKRWGLDQYLGDPSYEKLSYAPTA